MRKRKLRKTWHQTRGSSDKTKLNETIREIEILLHKLKNGAIQNYLRRLTSTEKTEFSLGKPSKKLKRRQAHIPPIQMNNGKGAKSDDEKASTLVEHLKNTFVPFTQEIPHNKHS